jgi:phosphohistidine phosphatase SixA
MSLNPFEPPAPRCGDYVVIRHSDTPEHREDAERQLANQGCKGVRFVVLEDGRLQAHGYLRAQ